MQLRKGFELRQVCGENVLMAEGLEAIDFSKLVNLNETATFLWKEAEAQGEFSIESLSSALCNEYDVDEASATADVKAMLESWKEIGLLS